MVQVKRIAESLLLYARLTAAVAIVLALIIASWKLERWLNWKLDYGNRVDQKLEALELRIRALEREQVPIVIRKDGEQ